MNPHVTQTHPLRSALHRAGVIATLRAPSDDAAFTAVDALVEAGIHAIEVTYTTPHAGRVIAGVAQRFGAEVLLGAGTLTEPQQVVEAVASGAQFLVSPGYEEEVADSIFESGSFSMIGGYTATEVQQLKRRGADAVKFFPGSIGGPAALRALRAPFPNVDFIPTGGVNADNLREWFDAGALAVGAGSELLPAAAVRDGDRVTINRRARGFLDALRTVRNA